MPRILALLLATAMLSTARADLILTEFGKPRCVIVVGNVGRGPAEDLKRHLDRIASCDIPIITARETAKAPADAVRIYIGPSAETEKLGVAASALQVEQYRIKTAPGALMLIGSPRKNGKATAEFTTQFAVNDFLDRQLGVRWLWPGELGTVIPRSPTIRIADIDRTGRPAMLSRGFSTPALNPPEDGAVSPPVARKIAQETGEWNAHHQLVGGRSPYRFGHSFMKWWDKYHDAHPEYFATPPAGTRQTRPDRVKLCVSNPAVAERIVAAWIEAGSPAVWNVCPNDGSGFCTCDKCRALDNAGVQDPKAIWNSQANLSGRYIHLWNTVLAKMKQTRPDVKLCTYAYSAYRNFPPGAKLESGMVIGLIHSYDAFNQWRAWSDAGAKIMLRPNWWHSGGPAPYLPLHEAGKFMQFAMNNGMEQFHFDSNLGYFATQGPNYYLIARLAERPDLSVDQVIDEWCSAFGPAAPQIRKYLDYWEQFTAKVGIDFMERHHNRHDPNGLFEQACAKHDYPRSQLSGSWTTLPDIYTDEMLAPAQKLLDEADPGNDPVVQARLQFLRDGLIHLRATRDLIALAYPPKEQLKPRSEELKAKLKALMRMRVEWSPRHVVWCDVITGLMKQWRIRPFADGKIDLRGQ